MKFQGASLRRRIVWSTAAVSAIAMVAMIGTVVLVLAAVTNKSVASALDDRLALVSSAIESTNSGTVRRLEAPDDSVDDSTWIFDAKGRQIEGPKAGKHVQAVAESLSTVRTRTTFKRRERVYLASPVAARGSTTTNAVVVVSESLEPYEATRAEVTIGLSVLGLVVVAGSTAIAAWTVRRALSPVESMAARAEEWSEHDLEARFEGDETGTDEISSLGHTLNVLLDRVGGALRSEQQLTAELAHELRTPLTAIRGEAELALMHAADAATSTRLQRVVDLVERMNTTIGTLLAAARGHTERGTPGNAADIVASVFADHPQESRLSWTIDVGDDLPVAAPVDLAARALAPLVDNAARFARSSVTISAAAHDRAVEIIVSDDGGGVDEDSVEVIFGAGERRSGGDGAGLGLALSRRVARTLGGDVKVMSPASPTSFVLTLPRF